MEKNKEDPTRQKIYEDYFTGYLWGIGAGLIGGLLVQWIFKTYFEHSPTFSLLGCALGAFIWSVIRVMKRARGE